MPMTDKPPARTRWLRLMLAMTLGLAGEALAEGCSWSEENAALENLLSIRPSLSGASLAAGTDSLTSHIHHAGDFDDDTVVSLASASKLLSGLVILRLVDRGLIDLDAPVSDYLAEFSDAKGAMTMRQLFSHTAGLPGNRDGNLQPEPDLVILNDDSLSLAESVSLIACCVEMIGAPGEQFSYGGFSMQVAGRVAEVVAGADWEALVERELSGPLALSTIDFQGLGATRNYRIGGSARASLRDYRRVLEMLANGGVYRGQRFLSDAAMATLLDDQMSGKPVVYAPPTIQELELGYGFGGWLHYDQTGADIVAMSSKGAFDALPWFRPIAGDWGMLYVENFGVNLNDQSVALFEQINAQLDRSECKTPFQFTANAGLNGFWFDPDAEGQGLLVDLIPARGQVFAGWLTWDILPASEDAIIGDADQRWFTLQGDLDGSVANLTIFNTRNGAFAADAAVSNDAVGAARIEFHDCESATLDYTLSTNSDGSPPLTGQVPFIRLTPDQYCASELP